MNNFEHADATSIADAISLLASNGSSRAYRRRDRPVNPD